MVRFVQVLAITIAALGGISEGKHIRLIPDSFDTWSDNVYLNFSNSIDTSVPYANITYKFLKTIPDIEIHMEAQLRAKNNRNHFVSHNATFSICDVLSMRNAHPLTVLAFAQASRYGNFPDKCPIEKGTYKMTKVWPPVDNIPENIPEVEGEIILQMFAIDNKARHMILNNKFMGHSSYSEGSSSFFSMLKG